MELTGKYYFKSTWRGLVLYVEQSTVGGLLRLKYRRAKERDIVELGLNYTKK